eukprot:CAMPEP_0115827910 /NCGR_PEP_ID=MMETSP0287-20121206/297_1 /TAXON_ID=412157 /ORGANISM="Chrysochromulina rotalis, Strain UIO044" /LENGTH=149 /DNA_ID=CAMNT_0003281101 /DNA_START=197 /DNA_END=646 /DNA_ORIENTATION=+
MPIRTVEERPWLKRDRHGDAVEVSMPTDRKEFSGREVFVLKEGERRTTPCPLSLHLPRAPVLLAQRRERTPPFPVSHQGLVLQVHGEYHVRIACGVLHAEPRATATPRDGTPMIRRPEQWGPERPQRRLAVHERHMGRGQHENIELASF